MQGMPRSPWARMVAWRAVLLMSQKSMPVR